MTRRILFGVGTLIAMVAGATALDPKPDDKPDPKDWRSGIAWPEPKVIDPGSEGHPPSDAIVLFDGKDLSKWEGGEEWAVQHGYCEVRKRDIRTKDRFGDYQLHLEFATPAEVKGNGQGRGNSGVYLADRYELQVLD